MPKAPKDPGPPPFDPAVEADDAREFEAFLHGQDPRDIEAATWVARRRNGLDAEEEARLQAWLDADPENAAAFDDMDAVLGEVDQLPGADVAQLKESLREEAAAPFPPTRPVPPPNLPSRRPWSVGRGGFFRHAALAAALFCVIGGGWAGWERWQRRPAFDQSFATRSGEQLTIRLPDADNGGSSMQLDTATQVDARLYRDRREVRLKDGQAMFTVSSDPFRPFHVWAGSLRITVAGTRFSVRHTRSGLNAGRTVVSVEEGLVRIARTVAGDEDAEPQETADDSPIELGAGQMVMADEDGRIGRIAAVHATAIAPWRSGRINFDQTPLADALAEFERYGSSGLVVRDPAVAALPVGGSYSTRQFQRFAQTLPQVLPVRLVPHGDVMEIVAQ